MKLAMVATPLRAERAFNVDAGLNGLILLREAIIDTEMTKFHRGKLSVCKRPAGIFVSHVKASSCTLEPTKADERGCGVPREHALGQRKGRAREH